MDMENQAIPDVKPASPSRRWNFFKRAADNPVILKELRARMRRRQAFILLTGYLAAIGLVVGLVYFSLSSDRLMGAAANPDYRQGVGKAIFATAVLLELFLVSFIGPALTSGAITSEREHQTFDLLRTTTLSERSLVWGKLASSFVYLLLLIFTAVPVEGIVFLLGGVGLGEVLVSILLLVVTAFFYCSLGLFFSSWLKRTLAATVTSYSIIFLSYVALGLTFFLMVTLLDGSSFSSSRSGVLYDLLTRGVLWTLISTNPLLAAIVSEVVLVDEQSLFISTTTISGSRGLPLPSPWLPYTVIYLLLALVLIVISIRLVRRPDR